MKTPKPSRASGPAAADGEVPDPENLFRMVAEGAWSDALAWVRRAPAGWSGDRPVAARAGDLLVSGLDATIDSASLSPDDLELLVVLGRAGRLPVSRNFEAKILERLLVGLAADPGRALSVSRFRPDLPACAAVIAQYGIPERRKDDFGTMRTGTVEPAQGVATAGRPVFRSPRERAFHEAAVRAFGEDLVCPNVALSAALDFERLRARLAPEERRVFFTALVDCVVFSRARGFTPIHFFELDSPVHDDHHRAERDGVKDRIVALAGFRLVRIRPAQQADESHAYDELLASVKLV